MNYLYSTLLILLLFSCSKNNESGDLPECLEERAQSFQDTWEGCEQASILKLRFNDKEVFAFNDGICITDGGSYFYDGCDSLCTIGTFAGYSECDGVNIFNVQIDTLEVIWEAN